MATRLRVEDRSSIPSSDEHIISVVQVFDGSRSPVKVAGCTSMRLFTLHTTWRLQKWLTAPSLVGPCYITRIETYSSHMQQKDNRSNQDLITAALISCFEILKTLYIWRDISRWSEHTCSVHCGFCYMLSLIMPIRAECWIF